MPQSTLVLNVNILHCVIYFTRVITNYLNLNFRNIDGGKLQRSGDTDEQRFVKSTDGHYTRFCSMSAVFRQYGYQLNGIKRLKIYSQKTHHHREYWLTRGKYWWTGRGGGAQFPHQPHPVLLQWGRSPFSNRTAWKLFINGLSATLQI